MWLDRAASRGFSGFEDVPPPAKGDIQIVRLVYEALEKAYEELPSAPFKLPSWAAGIAPERPMAIQAETEGETARKRARPDVRWAIHILRSTPPPRRLFVAAALLEDWPVPQHFFPSLHNPKAFLGPKETRRVAQVQSTFPYPCAPLENRAKVVLGTSPKMQSYDLLTDAEAHAWFSCYPNGEFPFEEEPVVWFLLTQLGIHTKDQPPHYTPILNERRGLEWFASVWRDPARREALLRERVIRTPAGGELHGSFYSRLDEVAVEDLTRSVERTFRVAIERLLRSQRTFAPDEQLMPVPDWWVDVPYAKLLLTPRDLSTEGDEMSHCAAYHASGVAGGDSIVISLRCKNARSTVELDQTTLEVRQHVGPGNKSPHPDCVQILETLRQEWLKRASRVAR